MKCPLCNSNSKFVFNTSGVDILDCVSCSHRFADIQPNEEHVKNVYDDTYFNDGGAGYDDYLLESQLLIDRGRNYAKKLEPFIKEKGKVLDVGAAAGCILKGYIEEGWKGVGIEPNANMAEFGRKEYDLDIKEGAFESYAAENQFDLISMIQVVPHFYKQRMAFANAAKLLKEGGLLLIESWNRNSVSAKIFGKSWHEYAPPSVLHWYSIDSLSNFLKEFGFEKVTHGRPAKKISGKHVKSLLKYKLGDTFIVNMIPEKINFPYPAEDLFWALYRKKELSIS